MGDCVKKSTEGNPVDHDDLKNITTPYTSCSQFRDSSGNRWFVKLEGRGDLTKIPVTPITSGGDGIYTFIVDQRGRVTTTRIINAIEINAKHFSMVLRDPSITSVRAAGELRKSGTNLEFNVLSGTFMKDWIDDCESEIVEQAKRFLQAAFPGDTVTYNPAEYARTKIDTAALDSYVAAGYEVQLFKNRRGCMGYGVKFYENMLKNKLGDPVTNELELRLAKDYEVYRPGTAAGRRRKTRRNRRKSRKMR